MNDGIVEECCIGRVDSWSTRCEGEIESWNWAGRAAQMRSIVDQDGKKAVGGREEGHAKTKTMRRKIKPKYAAVPMDRIMQV